MAKLKRKRIRRTKSEKAGLSYPPLPSFPETFLDHCREVWRHQHRFGLGTHVLDTGSWLVCARDNGQAFTFIPGPLLDFAPAPEDIVQLCTFVRGMCRAVPVCHALLPAWWTPAADAAGFRLGHWREGWVLTRDDFAGRARPRTPKGFKALRVETVGDAHKFKFVVDQACTTSYGAAPSHLWGAFSQLIDPPYVTAWLGRLNGDPVRTLALHKFRGVASLSLGSTLPSVRGRHLGDGMLHDAVAEAFADPSMQYVAAQTMPAAFKIAERLGAHPLLRFGYWVLS